jgi:AcrR family transcriptional regulator
MARKAGSHAEITGPAIRDAALRLFARSGFAAVSMREIAAEVGVRAGALYLYTPDKQSLLFDLMHDHMQSLLAAWREARVNSGPPFQRLETFVRFHIRYHFDRNDHVFLAYMEFRSLTGGNHDAIRDLRRAYEAELEAILADGQASGDFDLPDVRVTALALIAKLNGVLTWYRDGGRLARDDIERVYWTMIQRMVTT